MPVLINVKTRKSHPIFCNASLKDNNREISFEIIFVLEKASVSLIWTTPGKLKIMYFPRRFIVKATRDDNKEKIAMFFILFIFFIFLILSLVVISFIFFLS